MTSLYHLCCWVAIKIKFRNCFHFCFRSCLRAAETKGFPLVSADLSCPRPRPRPCPCPHPFPCPSPSMFVSFPFGPKRPPISHPLSMVRFVLEKFCFTSGVVETQNYKNVHSENHKNWHNLSKEICFGFDDIVDVSTVGNRCFFALNAVEASVFMKFGDCGCSGRMRRIVQIPVEGLCVTILVHIQGASSFSVEPFGPILTCPFELLILGDPSGSPGEPWGDAGTLGDLSCSIFELFEQVFASLQQAITTKTTWTTTSARSLPPLGSAAAGLGGCRVSVWCVPVCLVCACAFASASVYESSFLLLACRPLSSAHVFVCFCGCSCLCTCLCQCLCRPVGQSVCQTVCRCLCLPVRHSVCQSVCQCFCQRLCQSACKRPVPASRIPGLKLN